MTNFAFIFLSLLMSTIYSSGIVVEYKKQYEGHLGAFTLGDIAEISGDQKDSNDIEMLKEIFIGHMPRPGRTQKFYMKTAEKFKIIPVIGINKVRFEGSKMVLLIPKSQSLSKEKLKTIIKKFVNEKAVSVGDSLEIKFKSIVKTLLIPEGEYELHWKVKPNFDSRGQEQVTMEVFQNNKFISRHRFNVLIRQWQKVVQTIKKINKGDLIREDQIALISKEVTHDKRSMPVNFEEVLGKEARRTLVAKRVLFSHELAEPKLVSVGQSIQLKVKLGKSFIKVAGIARENGVLNEEIRVLNKASQKPLQGVVRASGVVEIIN
tara:strand:+ start:2697 stop:3656 length:960 start_codon:yes stop_codon:yes gene_type:complete